MSDYPKARIKLMRIIRKAKADGPKNELHRELKKLIAIRDKRRKIEES